MIDEIDFDLTQEYIELVKLFKLLNICESGGMVRHFLDEELIIVNNEIEYRKRRKLRKGDIVKFEETIINIK